MTYHIISYHTESERNQCQIVQSVAELTVRRGYQERILEEHQKALQNVPDKCYGVGQQNKE